MSVKNDSTSSICHRRPAEVAAGAPARCVNILMYHSISDRPGPTSISPALFRAQMEVLAECGYRAITLGEYVAWHSGKDDLPAEVVVITFDDGFADFSIHAFPCLHDRQWPATVFLPTAKLGGQEDWAGADRPPRPLLSWDQVCELGEKGIEFGAHSVTHADLTVLKEEELRREVLHSKHDIEQRTGRPVCSFAPPYGRSNGKVRAVLRTCYQVAVGTRLARADRSCDLFDLPRIEMHYFRDIGRWRAYLEGHGEAYFHGRRFLRRVRHLASQWSV